MHSPELETLSEELEMAAKKITGPRYEVLKYFRTQSLKVG